ncbi:MAG: ERMES complex subunit mmm1 [Thelocarpon superellum]|nr:MAG: ERMES complex subunit mmm1 [Thelocarpon superellum]
MLYNLSFTQGFLLGQLSIVVLIGAFIKFFIFGDLPSADSTATARATARRERTLAHRRSRSASASASASISSSSSSRKQRSLRRKGSSILRNAVPLTTATILRKTYYNVDAHPPESVDWFNVLVAQTIAQLRSEAQHDDAVLTSLTRALNGDSKPDYVDEIRVTELSLGEEFPIFSNCRVGPVGDDVEGGDGSTGASAGRTEGGRLEARMDVDLGDLLTIGIETKLILNHPQPMVAILPVALTVSVVRFSGTLSISFIPSLPKDGPSPTTLAFSFLDDYRLDLSIRSLVGSRSRLQDVPKITQLVEARLHAWFDDRCVEPRFQQIALPSLWPRRKNTRGGEVDVEAELDEGRDVSGAGGVDGADEGLDAASAEPRTEAASPPAHTETGGLRRRAQSHTHDAERRPDDPSPFSSPSRHVMPGSMPGMTAV